MAEKLIRFSNIINKGQYIFHFHTSITDGENTLAEYCDFAKASEINALILTEHIRRNISYDFDRLKEEALKCKKKYYIEILVGVETKVLPDGNIDINEEQLSQIDLLGIAIHSFPFEDHSIRETMVKIFQRYKDLEIPKIWLHPGRSNYFKRNEKKNELLELLDSASTNGFFIERNIKDCLDCAFKQCIVTNHKYITGYDAHSVEELKRLLIKNL
jgi:DNA polymerase (family 10)/putative hydrolase